MGDTANGTWTSRELGKHIDEEKARKLLDACRYWRFQHYIHPDPREEDCDEACEQLRAAIDAYEGKVEVTPELEERVHGLVVNAQKCTCRILEACSEHPAGRVPRSNCPVHSTKKAD